MSQAAKRRKLNDGGWQDSSDLDDEYAERDIYEVTKDILEWFAIRYEEEGWEYRFDQEDFDFLQKVFKEEDFDFLLFKDILLDAIELEKIEKKACIIQILEDGRVPLDKLFFANGLNIHPKNSEICADWLLGLSEIDSESSASELS